MVECRSGHCYADRPVSLRWHGEDLLVERILARWREPIGPAFRVSTARGTFVLVYVEKDDRWRATFIRR